LAKIAKMQVSEIESSDSENFTRFSSEHVKDLRPIHHDLWLQGIVHVEEKVKMKRKC
jgi:hypothetical protein